MKSVDLLAELRQARAGLTKEHRAELIEAGIPEPIICRYPLIGPALIRVSGKRYQPAADGGAAYITPVLIADPASPETTHPLVYARHLGECVDLVAWHPVHPDRWALRTGAAAWLGCIEPQYMNPDPVCIRRSPLTWLQAGCDGLVLLSKAPANVYSLLFRCASILAEDELHMVELRKLVRQPWPLPRIAAVEQQDVA